MSYEIINGREIEILDDYYPEFFEPKPISPKTKGGAAYRKSKQPMFVDTSGNIHITIEEIRKPKIKRRPSSINSNIELMSFTGKRKIDDAFGPGPHDEERYGQVIKHDFFKDHVGHDVVQEKENLPSDREKFYSVDLNSDQESSTSEKPKYDEAEILNWCYIYLASKKK